MENTIENTMEKTMDITMENTIENTMDITMENTMDITMENTMDITMDITMENTMDITMENNKISLKQLLSKDYEKYMKYIHNKLFTYLDNLFNIKLFPKIIEYKSNPKIDIKLIIIECFNDLYLIANDFLRPEIIITKPTDIEIEELIIILSNSLNLF